MGMSNTVQQEFHFRNDDGSITTATYIGAQNSDQSFGVGAANKFRIRILVEENAAGTANIAGHLFYSHNDGTYTEVTAVSSVIQEVDDNNSIADDVSSGATQQLTYSGTYAAGRYSDDGISTTNVSLSSTFTEFEFCLQIIDADVADGDTIDLRVYSGTTALNAYTRTPRITVSEPAAARQPRHGFVNFQNPGIA